MTAIRRFIGRFTLPFVILFAALTVPVSYVVSDLTDLIPASFAQQVIDELVHMIWPVGLALLFGYGFIFTGKGLKKTFGAGLGVFLFYVFGAGITVAEVLLNPDAVWETPEAVILGLLSMVGIGIREEVLFRGIITNSLALRYARSVKGVWCTLLLSGVLFGGVHMYNALMGVSVAGALVQSLGAFGVGILFTAIYLRGGNLWFLAITHAIVDFMGLFESTFVVSDLTQAEQMDQLSSIGPLIVIPASILLSAFLLRKKKMPAVLERIEALRNELGC